MLEFEHIVQVNDLNDDRFIDLTREQLWQGLVLRARSPQKFNRGLDCRSEDLDDNAFMRTIDTGSARFRERVELYPQEKICTRTIGESDQIRAQSVARIEEPESGYLFVRFSYRRELDNSDARVDVGDYLKAAYMQLDTDAIAMIRMLAECEVFDQSIN